MAWMKWYVQKIQTDTERRTKWHPTSNEWGKHDNIHLICFGRLRSGHCRSIGGLCVLARHGVADRGLLLLLLLLPSDKCTEWGNLTCLSFVADSAIGEEWAWLARVCGVVEEKKEREWEKDNGEWIRVSTDCLCSLYCNENGLASNRLTIGVDSPFHSIATKRSITIV